MTESIVRKADALGAEEQRDVAFRQSLTDESRSIGQSAHVVMEFASSHGGGANDQGTVGNGFGDRREFFGAGQNRRSSHRGTCLAIAGFVRIHDAHVQKSEVTHGARGSANVQGIARIYENDV
jgi:hypothetical protein